MQTNDKQKTVFKSHREKLPIWPMKACQKDISIKSWKQQLIFWNEQKNTKRLMRTKSELEELRNEMTVLKKTLELKKNFTNEDQIRKKNEWMQYALKGMKKRGLKPQRNKEIKNDLKESDRRLVKKIQVDITAVLINKSKSNGIEQYWKL